MKITNTKSYFSKRKESEHQNMGKITKSIKKILKERCENKSLYNIESEIKKERNEVRGFKS